MLIAEKKVVYKAFGLSITSEIPLPELSWADNQADSINVEIKVKYLSGDTSDFQNDLIINQNLVLFKVPDTAIFSIEDGERITVSLMNEYDEDLIRLYILGSCMGAILMQRKIYPLHGSAVAIDGKAYAIVGDSGAGKSTLASAFLSQGYHLLSDDVIAVSLSEQDHIPFVTPSYPQQKLWQESLDEFGIESSRLRSIFGRETKFCIPVSSQYFSGLLPLAGIFELIKTGNGGIEICKIENLERFHTLYRHTYRNILIKGLGLMEWHFQTSANILNSIEIFQLRRPVSGFTATELVSTILRTLNKGE